jgi:hypothetical protein
LLIAVTYVSSIYKHQIGEKHRGTLWTHSIPAPWFARENSAATVAVRRASAAMYAAAALLVDDDDGHLQGLSGLDMGPGPAKRQRILKRYPLQAFEDQIYICK